MKMTKILILMGGIMLAVASLWADSETVDGIVWNYTVIDGKAEVGIGGLYGTRAVSTSTTGAIVIPSTLGGNPVISVGAYAFYGCSGLTSMTIPDSVTSIGYEAFAYCRGLTSVTIGNGVTSIGDLAFFGCRGLTSVTIGNGVTSIGYEAFRGCSGLTSVTIPDGVTNIGYEAFAYCSGLTSVTIPESVTSIGYYAFDYCNAALFDTTTIPGVKLVDGWAVGYAGYTSSLSGHLDLTGVRGIGASAFNGCSGLTSVTIPEGVTSIGEGTFGDCSGLTSVTIPDGVTSIGFCAFNGCSGLTSVTIPASVTSIGSSAFESWSLTNVVFMGDAPVVGWSSFYIVGPACVASISPKSTGWGVVVGEKWNGLTLQYWPEVLVEAANAAEVQTIMSTFADGSIAAEVANVAEYESFRAWVDEKNLYQPSVVASPYAAAAYLLGAGRLFENEPAVEFGEVAVGAGSVKNMTVTATVKDGGRAVAVDAAKVAAMFEATSDLGDWNGAARLTPTVTVSGADANGAMRFVVTPGDGTASRVFLRIRR